MGGLIEKYCGRDSFSVSALVIETAWLQIGVAAASGEGDGLGEETLLSTRE